MIVSLSACGSDTSDEGGKGETDGAAPGAASTALTIVVTPGEDAKASAYDLTCDPAGGDHPQAEQACAAVAKAGASVFESVAADQTCTQVYGGPQSATVKGTYEGDPVDASFSRENGCEIDRWEKLGTTFFNLPLQ